MRSGDLSNLPNPFALDQPKRGRLGRLVSAIKILALVAIAFAVLLTITSRGPDWLASRLTNDFASLDSSTKQQRLVQLSQLGDAGIEPMMAGLADQDPAVAQKAIELIRDWQTTWSTLPKKAADKNQLALVTAIRKHADTFPPAQQDWASVLLNQLIIENVEASDNSSREVFVAANRSLTTLTPFDNLDATGTSIKKLTAPANGGVVAPSRQSASMKLSTSDLVVSEPLPISAATTNASWTDWPPQRPTILRAGFLDQDEADNTVAKTTATTTAATTTALLPTTLVAQASLSLPITSSVTDDHESPNQASAVSPQRPMESSYRMGDQTPNVEAPAAQTPNPQTPSIQMPTNQAADVHTPAAREAVEQLDTASLIKFLGSERETVRLRAQEELKVRGFGETELQVAKAIASSDATYRIELIRQLTTQQTIDPTPWLLLMLKDSEREVKLAAVSALDRMLNPQIRKALRLRMIDETDQKVVLRIRSVLGLSAINRQ